MTETQTILKPEDLRIGNWVMEVLNKEKEVVMYMRVGSLSRDTLIDFEPIPLTPEILEKAGFKLSSEYGLPSYFHALLSFDIDFREDGIFVVLHHDIWHELVKIEYVHQLQNLFYVLTGTELEINL